MLAIVILLSGGAIWYYKRLSNLDKVLGIDWTAEQEDISNKFEDKVVNILLMGFDRNQARDEIYSVYRPDTLMVVAINLETAQVDIVSIPRDTLVTIHNRKGKDKINHAYYYGWDYKLTGVSEEDHEERHRLGLESQIETVRKVLKGIPIHFYISVDMESVRELVDIMGGVYYDVERNVRALNGRLLIEKGYQKLNGQQFLYYVRNRNFSEYDYGRVQNQQKILISAFQQFKSSGKLLKAPQIYLSMRNKIETNLNLEQIAALALFAAQKIQPESINSHFLQGKYEIGRLHHGQTSNNIYYLMDQKSRTQLVYDIWGIESEIEAQDKLLPKLPNEKEEKDENEYDRPQMLESDTEQPIPSDGS